MDKELNNKQEILAHLIVNKEFEALTKEEKTLVLGEVTVADYSFRRKVLLESKDLYIIPTPNPLYLEKKRGVVIPLYQAVSGVAAAVIAMFFIMNSTVSQSNPNSTTLLAAADTVYIHKNSVDTVYEYKTEFIDRVVYRSAEKIEYQWSEGLYKNGLNNQSFELPDLSTLKLENLGSPAVNDQALIFLNDF